MTPEDLDRARAEEATVSDDDQITEIDRLRSMEAWDRLGGGCSTNDYAELAAMLARTGWQPPRPTGGGGGEVGEGLWPHGERAGLSQADPRRPPARHGDRRGARAVTSEEIVLAVYERLTGERLVWEDRMTTMRERLARALCFERQGYAKGEYADPMCDECRHLGKCQSDEPIFIDQRAATAILAELREPDEGMVDIGEQMIDVGAEIPAIWRAMIDHALSER